MSTQQPLMDRTAWLVAGVTVLAFGLVVGASVIHDQRQSVTQGKHLARSTDHSGVQVKTSLSLRQTYSLTEVVATVSILNTTNQPIAYVGFACSDPATVSYISTRPVPDGPPYPPSAAALRTQIMEYRRTLDTPSPFANEQPSKDASCDESAPPILPPHKQLQYTLSAPFAAPDIAFLDSATTQVDTKVQLGKLISADPGGRPVPVQPTDAVEVRSPLSSLGTAVKISDAQYERADQVFGELMKNPAIGSFISAQDPALWRTARMQIWTTHWTLEAFNRKWATPLNAAGDGDAIDSMSIPTELAVQRPVVDAAFPSDAEARTNGFIPYRDVYAGDLVLPSGLVMVGDPVYSDYMLKFDYGLKPGRYAIHVVTARARYLGDESARPTWEELLLSDLPATHWEPAVPVGHSIKELKSGQLFSWNTDGATGGFASPEAMKFMDESLRNDIALYTSLGEREEANDWIWGILTVDSKTNANVFASEAGFGDGGYGVLLGRDAQNKPAALLSDFGVLDMTYSGIHGAGSAG